MNLYLLRHAVAVGRELSDARHDDDRPLTGDGARKMRRVAKSMKRRGLSFDVILTSPVRRAEETARIVAKVLGGRVEISPHLKITGNPATLVKRITCDHGRATDILLVGHEPYLSNLVAVLVSGSGHLAITMKKGGLCKLSLGSLRLGRCATLEWLMGPRQLLGG